MVQNDSAFGLLLAEGAHEDSYTSRLYLDGVTYLRVHGKEWSYTDFLCIAIYQEDAVWFAKDLGAGRFFPHPSKRPYHVVFISHAEFSYLLSLRNESRAYPVFESAQKHFGRLPGFSFHRKSLQTPGDYATATDALSLQQYVTVGSIG